MKPSRLPSSAFVNPEKHRQDVARHLGFVINWDLVLMVSMGPLTNIKLDPFSFYWVLRIHKSNDNGETDLAAQELYKRLQENQQYREFFDSPTLVDRAYVALCAFMETYNWYQASVELNRSFFSRIWNYRRIKHANLRFYETLVEMQKACNEYEFVRKLSLTDPDGLIFKFEFERYLLSAE